MKGLLVKLLFYGSKYIIKTNHQILRHCESGEPYSAGV